LKIHKIILKELKIIIKVKYLLLTILDDDPVDSSDLILKIFGAK